MGTKYIPLIQGEIFGLKKGINTHLNLWEHSQKLNFDDLDREYLIGFGVGFTKAQQIREKISQENGMSYFEVKVNLIEFLIKKHVDNYVRFNDLLNDFLSNIKNWLKEDIPLNDYDKIHYLLKNQKLQRAIDHIYNFNYDNHRLKLIQEFEEVKVSLVRLRELKRQKEIDEEDYKNGQNKIEIQLRQWIEKRKN